MWCLMARLTYLTSLLCLSILLPLGLAGQTQQPPPQIDPAFRSQTQDSVLPPETRAQINKLASRVAEQLHKSETNPAGRKLLVMDFPIADSTQVSELGVLLANQFSESLSSYAGGFVVADRAQVATMLKEEEITRESLLNKEMGLYVAKKAGADETLTGFLVKGLDGNLILSVRVFGPQKKETLDATYSWPKKCDLRNLKEKRSSRNPGSSMPARTASLILPASTVLFRTTRISLEWQSIPAAQNCL